MSSGWIKSGSTLLLPASFPTTQRLLSGGGEITVKRFSGSAVFSFRGLQALIKDPLLLLAHRCFSPSEIITQICL